VVKVGGKSLTSDLLLDTMLKGVAQKMAGARAANNLKIVWAGVGSQGLGPRSALSVPSSCWLHCREKGGISLIVGGITSQDETACRGEDDGHDSSD
jgi:hypothetical protein